MRTSDKIAIAGVLVGVLALYPAYSALRKNGPAPSPTTLSTGSSTTVSSVTQTTGEESAGGSTTTRPPPPPTTQPPVGGVTFRMSLDLGEGVDIDRRRRSNGLAAGVDLVNSGGSLDYKGAENLAYAPIAVSGAPTKQECAALYQQSSNTWPTIRFDLWSEGQDFCMVTGEGRLAAFRIEKLPVDLTASVVRLAVVVLG